MFSNVVFAGSRDLSDSFAPLISAVVRSVIRSGRTISVGCCVGLDAVVLSSAPVGAVRCFAAFGAGGEGACGVSAVGAVRRFAAAGGAVSWFAGGGAAVPVRGRLACRTRAVVASGSAAAVVFFSSPDSVGSLLAARLAVRRGLPVFGFPCGFDGSALPSLGAGRWVAVGGRGVWSAGFRWAC